MSLAERVLEYLRSRPGQWVMRDELIAEVWGWRSMTPAQERSLLSQHIARVRATVKHEGGRLRVSPRPARYMYVPSMPPGEVALWCERLDESLRHLRFVTLAPHEGHEAYLNQRQRLLVRALYEERGLPK